MLHSGSRCYALVRWTALPQGDELLQVSRGKACFNNCIQSKIFQTRGLMGVFKCIIILLSLELIQQSQWLLKESSGLVCLYRHHPSISPIHWHNLSLFACCIYPNWTWWIAVRAFDWIPKDPERQHKWITAIKHARSEQKKTERWDATSNGFRSCSDHFISGKLQNTTLPNVHILFIQQASITVSDNFIILKGKFDLRIMAWILLAKANVKYLPVKWHNWM